MSWGKKQKEILSAIESLREEVGRVLFFSDAGKRDAGDGGQASGESCGSDEDTKPKIDYIALLEERISRLEERVRILESVQECNKKSLPAVPVSSFQKDEPEEDNPDETDKDILFPSLFDAPETYSETSIYDAFLDHCRRVYPKLLQKAEQLFGSKEEVHVPDQKNPDYEHSLYLDVQAGYDMLEHKILKFDLYGKHGLIVGNSWLFFTSWIIESLCSTNHKDLVQFITFNCSQEEAESLFTFPKDMNQADILSRIKEYLLMSIEDSAHFPELEDYLKSECSDQLNLFRKYNFNSFTDYARAVPEHPEMPRVPYLVLIVGHPDQLPKETADMLISIIRNMRSMGITMLLAGGSEPLKNHLVYNTAVQFFISESIGIMDTHNRMYNQQYFITPYH